MECLQLTSKSDLLGAERLGHSYAKLPEHKVLCQPRWPLTLCDLKSDSMDSINEHAGDVDLETATL